METLLNDLLKCSNSLDKLKSDNKSLVSKSQEASTAISSYQRELSRLVLDNNRLHLELMNTKELHSSSQEKWRVACKRLELDCEDLRALSSIQQDRFSELEAEKDGLRCRLEEVLSKVYNPTSERGIKDSNLSMQEQNVVGKREFRISARLEESEAGRGFTRSQQEWAQELQDSDERVKKYQEQVEDVNSSREELKGEIERLGNKVANRDQEIERLVEILNSGEFAVKAPKRVAREENIEKIKVLNERLDLVNGENMKMEQELKVAKKKLAQIGNVYGERDALMISLENAAKEIEGLKQLVACKDVKENNTVESSRLGELQCELDNLRKEYQFCKDELLKLKKTNDEVSRNMETCEESLHKLKSDNAKLLQKYEESESLKQALEVKLANTEYSLEISETTSQTLEKRLEISQQSYQRLLSEHSSTTDTIRTLTNSLLSLETKNSILLSSISSLKQEISRLTTQKDSLDQRLDSLCTENLKSKTEADISLTSKQRLSVQLESLERQNSTLQSENQTLSQLVQSHKRANLDGERKIRELTGSLAACEERVRILQREQKAAADELLEQIEALRKSEGCKLALERENVEVDVFRQKWENSLSEIKRLKDALSEAEVEALKNKKELNGAKECVRRKEEEIKELMRSIDGIKAENKGLSDRIEIDEISRENYSGSNRKLQFLEEELERTGKLLESSVAKEKLLYKESENYKFLNKKLEEQVVSLSKQNERISQGSQSLEKEQFKLQALVAELQVEKNQQSTDIIRLEEKLYQSSLELEDAKRELSEHNDENYRNAQELKELKFALSSEQAQIVRLNDQIYQLRQFIQTLEASRDNVMKKLEISNKYSKELQEKIEVLKDEIAAHKRERQTLIY